MLQDTAAKFLKNAYSEDRIFLALKERRHCSTRVYNQKRDIFGKALKLSKKTAGFEQKGKCF
eukprot:snap_masked-scaffold_5-processed-gene-18.20-mRNA-1 protein AED:1.00 eAED:1.00 QI:0/0/0/0/1/1/2/0/61